MAITIHAADSVALRVQRKRSGRRRIVVTLVVAWLSAASIVGVVARFYDPSTLAGLPAGVVSDRDVAYGSRHATYQALDIVVVNATASSLQPLHFA